MNENQESQREESKNGEDQTTFELNYNEGDLETQQLSCLRLSSITENLMLAKDLEIAYSWTKIITKNSPKRRSYHTSVIYLDRYLYIFGGVDITDDKLGDIFKIDLLADKPEWIKVDNEGLMHPIAYHSSCLIGNTYYMVGGQDHTMHPLCMIQRFDMNDEKMLPIRYENDDEKAPFPGIQNHTADAYNGKIILYGGETKEGINSDVYILEVVQVKPKEKAEEGTEDASGLTIKAKNKTLRAEKKPEGRKAHSTLIKGDSLFILSKLMLSVCSSTILVNLSALLMKSL